MWAGTAEAEVIAITSAIAAFVCRGGGGNGGGGSVYGDGGVGTVGGAASPGEFGQDNLVTVRASHDLFRALYCILRSTAMSLILTNFCSISCRHV